ENRGAPSFVTAPTSGARRARARRACGSSIRHGGPVHRAAVGRFAARRRAHISRRPDDRHEAPPHALPQRPRARHPPGARRLPPLVLRDPRRSRRAHARHSLIREMINAILALEDGTTFHGISAGADGEARGEVVFNTSMSGYQEVLTDPSYAGQIVTMTCPEIGNYGVSSGDVESRAPQVAGFIVRDESPISSNWRAEMTLREYLVANKIVAISDIDTRALTRKLRSSGVMRGVVATGSGLDPGALVERARSIPQMEGSDLVTGVTSDKAFDWPQEDPDEFGIAPARRAK